MGLLQPELTEDQIEADVLLIYSFETAGIVDQARNATAALRSQLLGLLEPLWQLLAQLPTRGGLMPPGFLQNCADLSFFLAPESPIATNGIVESFSCACLACPGLALDPAALASLAVLLANSKAAPRGGQFAAELAPMANALMALPADSRSKVLEKWSRWRGPVRLAQLGQWAALLQTPSQSEPFSLAKELPPTPTATQGTVLLPQRDMTFLKDLLNDVPSEFRCKLDGQLMMDPVISPQGYIFERVSLANALTMSGGKCLITGEYLKVEDCQRFPELRKKITQWVRQRHPAARARPKLSAAVASSG